VRDLSQWADSTRTDEELPGLQDVNSDQQNNGLISS
jgi:hypothetical protein